MTRGRRTKLTQDVQEKVLEHLRRGFTLKAAAIHAGIAENTFFYWIRRAEKGATPELLQFLQSVRATLDQRREDGIRANPRHLARARYEGGKSAQQIAMALSEETIRMVEAGRVPWNVALVGLGLAISEIEDRLAAESPSWTENFTPFYDNDRARMEDSDE